VVTLILAEHYPVLVIVISMLAAFTILIAGLVNKKAAFPISLATIFVQLLMALSILKHVLANTLSVGWLGAAMGHRICRGCV
jgi:hypothetical protein